VAARRKDIAPLVNDLIEWMKRERAKLSTPPLSQRVTPLGQLGPPLASRRFSFQPCKSMTDDRLMLLMFIASATVAAGALVTLLWLHL
jgi:hypothetical protein